MAVRTFRDLKVWQKSHELVLSIYSVTAHFPFEEKFGLVSQMRRAALSIACNLVEGFNRRTIKDSLNFYNVARGSLEELKYQLLVSTDLGFLNEKQHQRLVGLTDETGRLLHAWVLSQKANTSR